MSVFPNKATDYLKLSLTDGCKYVMEAANARWLFDEILYNQPRHEIRGSEFQVWVLWLNKINDKDKGCWVLRCEDCNKNTDNEQKEKIDYYIDKNAP